MKEGFDLGNQTIGTIRLSGKDAIEFANSLFRPTPEEIKDHNRYIECINENVEIRRSAGELEATIADLDLSFLDDRPVQVEWNIDVTVEVKKKSVRFYSNQESVKSKVTVDVERRRNG